MKKYILLVAVILAPSTSFAGSSDDFINMNCTQAITWAAAQIASPPPPNFTPKEWSKFTSNGGSETVAIQILSLLPGSPCTNFLPEKYPASDVVDGKNRGERSAP